MKKIVLPLIMVFLLSTITSVAQERSRSAKTGKYVTKGYANSHKSTTYTSRAKKK